MTEAALTLQALEECRNAALLKLTALDAQRPKIAYELCTSNSAIALQKWRQLDDEADRLLERVRFLMPRSTMHASLPRIRTGESSGG
jgi:hypothetical protein